MTTEKCPYCGSIKKCHDVGKDGKHYHCGNCGKIWERTQKISTTITKKFFDMKMQDLEKYGAFWEYKEDKPFWKKRLDKFESSAEIVFLVGKIPHRFLVVDIFQMHRTHIPARYRSAIQTDFCYVIKCIEDVRRVA